MEHKDGSQQSLGKLAFIELDKYSEDKKIKTKWLQWLEYFGNYLFSQKPIEIIEVADHMLDSSRLSKEERLMLDERLLRQEHHDMDIYSAREEGIEQGLKQGIEQEKRQLVYAMLAKGLEKSLVCELAGLTEPELDNLLSVGLT